MEATDHLAFGRRGAANSDGREHQEKPRGEEVLERVSREVSDVRGPTSGGGLRLHSQNLARRRLLL